MGICPKRLQPNQTYQLQQLTMVEPVGKGSFGIVWKVQHKLSRQHFALKKISKVDTIITRSVDLVLDERAILSCLDSKFMPRLACSYQDDNFLYLLMELVQGITLRDCLTQNLKFTESQCLIIVASIVNALQHIHQKNIVHRDLKPQNIILTSQGVRIVDLGIAKRLIKDKQNAGQTSGTLGYMAPQTLFRQNYSRSADYYSMGAVLHQLMFGCLPYQNCFAQTSKKDIMKRLMEKNHQIQMSQLPKGWSIESLAFLNSLIVLRPFLRLGAKNINDIKEHQWFQKYFKWDKFNNQQEAQVVEVPPQIKSKPIKIQTDCKEEVSMGTQFDQDRIKALLKEPSLFKGFQYMSQQLQQQTAKLIRNN